MPAILQVGGAFAVTAGATLFCIPAGFIVGGIFLLLIGLAVERGKDA